MKVDGTRSFAATREVVWSVINDPVQMAELMPGVQSFDVQDDRHWSAKVKIPLGLGGLKMSINFDKVEEREPEFAKLHAKGTGVGALMDMETQFHLAEEGAGTAMHWEADVRIAGPVGSMGQRVLQPIVNQQVSNVLNALDKQVVEAQARVGSPASPGGGSPASTGSAGAPEPTTEAVAATEADFFEGPEPGSPPHLPGEGAPSAGGGATAPATSGADPAEEEGSSGADEGVNPWSPKAYDEEPQGPTTSTEDRPS